MLSDKAKLIGDKNWGDCAYRDWLIGLAMQGVLANGTTNANETRIADYAILQADALLEVLAAEGSK